MKPLSAFKFASGAQGRLLVCALSRLIGIKASMRSFAVFLLYLCASAGFLSRFRSPGIASQRTRMFVDDLSFNKPNSGNSGMTNDPVALALNVTHIQIGKKGASQEIPPKSTQKRKRKRKSTHSRTNRVDGMRKWTKELLVQRQVINPALITELAKELLYSGIPEQVLEIYAAYYDLLQISSQSAANNEDTLVSGGEKEASSSNKVSEWNSVFLVLDKKLTIVTIRAHLALKNSNGAIQLLQAAMNKMTFDDDEKSALIRDLAEASPNGLKAALQLKDSPTTNVNENENENGIEEQNEQEKIEKTTISGVSYIAVLKGILEHGLSSSKCANNELLVDPKAEMEVLAKEHGPYWRMTTTQALEVAQETVAEYMAFYEENSSRRGKLYYKVLVEYMRVVFRIAAQEAKLHMSNFEMNDALDQENRARVGLRAALSTMEEYSIEWTVGTADVLVDECLRLGDVASIQFITEQMKEHNVLSQASTFNKLLSRYAEIGEGESAYHLVENMKNGPEGSQPDRDSYRLLLIACARSQRGLFLSKSIIQELQNNDQMFKTAYDRYVESQILLGDDFEPTLLEMIQTGNQPDEDTLIIMLDAFNKRGDMEGAMNLYRQLASSEMQRRVYRKQVRNEINSSSSSSDTTFENDLLAIISPSSEAEEADVYSFLPPPSRVITAHLLEILRDKGKHMESAEVIRDMQDRASEECESDMCRVAMGDIDPSDCSISITESGKFILSSHYSPDRTVYALALESCLNVDYENLKNDTLHSLNGRLDTYQMRLEKDLEERSSVALELFNEMEEFGLTADRRIYASLIKIFGTLKGDVPSALGVFNELRNKFVPDIEMIDSIIDVCKSDEDDLKTLAELLEVMVTEDDSIDLDIYSNDILMQLFPDATALSEALISMETAAAGSKDQISVGLSVLSALAQGIRRTKGLDELKKTLALIARVGILPDAEVMDYFRIPDAPMKNSPFSRAHHQLVPMKEKQRSLMDIDNITEDVKVRGGFKRSKRSLQADPVEFKEASLWSHHEAALFDALADESENETDPFSIDFGDDVSSVVNQEEGKDNRFSGRDDPDNLLASLASAYELSSGDAEELVYEDIYAEESESLLSDLASDYEYITPTPPTPVDDNTSLFDEQKVPKRREEYKSKASREKMLFTEDTPTYSERPKQKKRK